MPKAKSVPTPSPVSDENWQVEDALRTLIRAEEIEGDAKLMAKVRKLAAEKMADMSEIAEGADELEPDKDDKNVARLVKSGKISERQAAKIKEQSDART